MSFSNYRAKKVLESLKEGKFVQLHVGEPGKDGLNNVAKETKRKAVAFNAPVGNEMSNSVTVEWEEVLETEEYSHVSIWDAEKEGNCETVEALKAKVPVTKGQDFRFKAGKLVLKAN